MNDESGELRPATERMENVLAFTFRGLHNAPRVHKHKVGEEWEYWEVNAFGDLSTYDLDQLTRLVLAAHDNCVRASVQSSGPRMVKIALHPRFTRTGSINNKCPEFDEHIAELRGKT